MRVDVCGTGEFLRWRLEFGGKTLNEEAETLISGRATVTPTWAVRTASSGETWPCRQCEILIET